MSSNTVIAKTAIVVFAVFKLPDSSCYDQSKISDMLKIDHFLGILI